MSPAALKCMSYPRFLNAEVKLDRTPSKARGRFLPEGNCPWPRLEISRPSTTARKSEYQRSKGVLEANTFLEYKYTINNQQAWLGLPKEGFRQMSMKTFGSILSPPREGEGRSR